MSLLARGGWKVYPKWEVVPVLVWFCSTILFQEFLVVIKIFNIYRAISFGSHSSASNRTIDIGKVVCWFDADELHVNVQFLGHNLGNLRKIILQNWWVVYWNYLCVYSLTHLNSSMCDRNRSITLAKTFSLIMKQELLCSKKRQTSTFYKHLKLTPIMFKIN